MYIPSAPRFHSPSVPLRAALESLPGYASHVRAAEALKAPLAEAKAAQENAMAAATNAAAGLAEALLTLTAHDLATAIEDGATLAANTADMARAAESKAKLLEAAENQLGIELDDIIRTGYNRILKHLNGTLQDAYAKSRELGLGGIHDAEQALEAGKVDAWKKMVELRTIIFQVRDAQAVIVGRLGSHEAIQRVKSFGLLANYAELWPGFLEGSTGAQWAREDITPPWPTINGEADPTELHAWILSNDAAEPWVPTDAELIAAVKEATAAARASAHAAHVGQDA